MFGVAVLDVVIGLSFVYFVLSLACTALKELLESVRRTRASNLRKGIEALLMDRSGVGLADQLYQHALIEGLCKKKNKFPTYIPARNFALALLDIVARKTVDPPSMASREGAIVGASPAAMALSSNAGVLAPLRSKISAASDLEPVRDALLPLIDDA
nr:hypothetical protein [Acidobacteriota bacterium]